MRLPSGAKVQNNYVYYDYPYWSKKRQRGEHRREYIGKIKLIDGEKIFIPNEHYLTSQRIKPQAVVHSKSIQDISIPNLLDTCTFLNPSDTSRYPYFSYICSDGIELLQHIRPSTIRLVFFDPEYGGAAGDLHYGTHDRQQHRYQLPQMTDDNIGQFIHEISRVLMPSGYLMLWADKYAAISTVSDRWVSGTDLVKVDCIVWSKGTMGMGYRSRSVSEYLLVFQKPPVKAKETWHRHDIPDVWTEKVEHTKQSHPHCKPVGLQAALIEACTAQGDIVVDPAAGSFSVMTACATTDRIFLGCDLCTEDVNEDQHT